MEREQEDHTEIEIGTYNVSSRKLEEKHADGKSGRPYWMFAQHT